MILFAILVALQQQRHYSLHISTSVPDDQRAWAFVPSSSKETPIKSIVVAAAAVEGQVTNNTTKDDALVFQIFDFSVKEKERIAQLLFTESNENDQDNNDTASSSFSPCETKALKCVGISDLNAT